jgi:hypothetical protein
MIVVYEVIPRAMPHAPRDRDVLGGAGAPVGEDCMSGYQFRQFEISEHMLYHIRRYVERHEPVGDFLTAVICNDLSEACGRADDDNLVNLPAFVAYFYNEADSRCWGSCEKMEKWLAMREDIGGEDENPA